MRFALRTILLFIFILTTTACVSNVNLTEGIRSFQAQDYRRAFVRLVPEAKKGQPDAQYAVGYMYYYGQGVIEDRKVAWYWINRAADAGQPEAKVAADILRRQAKLIIYKQAKHI